MKLAEALQERADLNRRIEQLRYRLNNNVLVQEGEKPLEDPAALLEELESSFTRLEWLIARINLTNCAVKVEGRSLTELIARRDVLSLAGGSLPPLGGGSQPKYPPRHPHRDQDPFRRRCPRPAAAGR